MLASVKGVASVRGNGVVVSPHSSLLDGWGTESAAAHKWAGRLHNPCRLGGPQRFRAGDRISSGTQVGRGATEPLPPFTTKKKGYTT